MVLPRSILTFLLPGGALLLGTVITVTTGAGTDWFARIEPVYPVATLLGSLLLGWRFNRSKIVLAVLSLVVADFTLRHLVGTDKDHAVDARAACNALAMLIPISFTAIAFIRERGVFTPHGISRMGLVVLQLPAIVIVYQFPALGLFRWIEAPVLGATGAACPAPLPLLAFAAGLIATAFSFARRRTIVESGLFWALVAAFCAVMTRRAAPAATVYVSSGLLILLVSVVEVSFGLAFRDELTGLPARRAFHEALQGVGLDFAVAVADIDFFKRINDRYGHDVGDQVLRMIASQLSRVPGGGKVYRYGGEEFVILFPGLTREEAAEHCEQVRRSIGALEFVIRGRNRPKQKPDGAGGPPASPVREKTQITISIGVADSSAMAEDPRTVVRAADRALYRAKHGGRNQVVA